jgi:hypothetical protein
MTQWRLQQISLYAAFRKNSSWIRPTNGVASPFFESYLYAQVVTEWINPSHEARNKRATSSFVSPTARLRLRFSQHHK